MSTMHFLSSDGKSKTFDQKANGYGRGEGCSFVVLKPLYAAIRDGNVIRAVVRNTGCNQDGQTPGLAYPAGEAQAALIREVYNRAGVDMDGTDYFEAHGTGTAVGDPIETEAIGKTIGASRSSQRPLWIGSIKPNIGHLEGASGVASLIKAIHMLEHAQIPPQIWLDKVNPRIHLDKWNLSIPRRLTPWPSKGVRRIAINLFGFGGSNALTILEDAYHYLKERGLQGNHNTINDGDDASSTISTDSAVIVSTPSPLIDQASTNRFSMVEQRMTELQRPHLIVWSAHEQSGIERVARLYQSYVNENSSAGTEQDQELLLRRLTYTAAVHRSHMSWRSFAIVPTSKQLANALESPATAIRTSTPPKVAFVFSGQGAQWFAMGRELLLYDVFSRSMTEASEYLSSHLGCTWSLTEEFRKDESNSNVNLPAFSQPICTALQVAMVQHFQSWGIVPSAVVGHSSGEIAAAFAKGAISREDTWRIAYNRGLLSSIMRTIAPHLDGSMIATELNQEEAEAYKARVTLGTISVACINSPASTTLAGDRSAIDEIDNLLHADGRFARKLKVQTAYHSKHMESISALYLESLRYVRPLQETPTSPIMFSSVTGDLIQNSDLGAEYWVKNMLSVVEFSKVLTRTLSYCEHRNRRGTSKSFIDVVVEIGPHGVLQGPIKQVISSLNSDAVLLPTLNRKQNAAISIAHMCGRLYQQGYAVDVDGFNPAECEGIRGGKF